MYNNSFTLGSLVSESYIENKVLTYMKKKPHIRVSVDPDGTRKDIYNGALTYVFKDSDNNQYLFTDRPFIKIDITEEDAEFCNMLTDDAIGKKFAVSARVTSNNVKLPANQKVGRTYFMHEAVCRMREI